MKLNPYQKIIKDGALIQPGQIDTPVKFGQLTQGVELQGNTLLDVGCNLGAMCNIATINGAITQGIDINPDYISQAKEIFPYLQFQCLDAGSIYGKYDLIIASAMLHYVDSLDTTLKIFSQSSIKTLCDVWLNDSPESIFTLSHRDIFIPSRSAFIHIAKKYFNKIEEKGLTLTPDISKRYVFHLSESKPFKPKAVIIYGESATGKTTLLRSYIEYKIIVTDNVNISWIIANRDSMFSAFRLANLARGNHRQEYIDFFYQSITNLLYGYTNQNVVIEGYDLTFEDLRLPIIEFLESHGWEVQQIETATQYEKSYV